MKLHIIYTESTVLLSKKDYATWQDVQRDFPDYKASLGPWPDSAVAEYLGEEYSSIFPSAQAQIAELRNSEFLFLEIGFLK
jgi:hypothetical protein